MPSWTPKFRCLVMIFVLGAAGCAGVKTSIRPVATAYPVSMTPTILDEAGHRYTPPADSVVGRFKYKRTIWAMFWGNVLIGPDDIDLTESLDASVAEHGGDAVINVKVQAKSDWLFYISAWVPIIPYYATVKASGDVVHLDTK